MNLTKKKTKRKILSGGELTKTQISRLLGRRELQTRSFPKKKGRGEKPRPEKGKGIDGKGTDLLPISGTLKLHP